MRCSARIPLVELALLLALGCRQAPASQRAPRPTASQRALTPWLAPRPSSRFVCEGSVCRQDYPLVPSSAEWRCAERERVVWCAGGDAAAGVVGGADEPRFRCGARWGAAVAERVCVDTAPEYPLELMPAHCRFVQEQGLSRLCTQDTGNAKAAPLPLDALPSCWLDRDCPAGRCDRGVCGCDRDDQCQQGKCREAHCVEGRR